MADNSFLGNINWTSIILAERRLVAQQEYEIY